MTLDELSYKLANHIEKSRMCSMSGHQFPLTEEIKGALLTILPLYDLGILDKTTLHKQDMVRIELLKYAEEQKRIAENGTRIC